MGLRRPPRQPLDIPLLAMREVPLSDFEADDISHLSRFSLDADVPYGSHDAVKSSSFESPHSSVLRTSIDRDLPVSQYLKDYPNFSVSNNTTPRSCEVFAYSQPTKFGTLFAWIWELLAIITSLTLLGATTGMLCYVNNTTLARWPLRIGPNTVLAVLVALARIALLFSVTQCLAQTKWIQFMERNPASLLDVFDAACRGPLGAIRLVLHLKIKNIAATFGAAIIIVSLAVDPFAQEVLSFPSRRGQALEIMASLQVTQDYDSGAASPAGGAIFFISPSDSPIAVQGAIFRGLYGLDDPFIVQCPTADCGWNKVMTLGACGECFDVTASSSGVCDNKNPAYDDGDWTCNFTTPNNFALQAYFGNAEPYAERGDYATLVTTAASVGYFSDQFTWLESTNISTLTRFAYLQLDDGGDATHFVDPGNVSNYRLSECYVAFCMRNYETIALNGTTTTIAPSQSWLLAFDTKYEGVNIQWPDSAGRSTFQVFENNSGPRYPGPMNHTIINYSDYISISDFITTLFSNTSTEYANGYAQLKGAKTTITVGSALWSTGNISKTVANIADSMTNAIRTGYNATQFNGTAWQPETYIKVNWNWFLLPLLTAGAAVLLQTIILVVTRRKRGSVNRWSPLWKSSSTAMLLYRLRGLESHDSVVNEKDIDQLARRIHIVLDSGSNKDLTFEARDG